MILITKSLNKIIVILIFAVSISCQSDSKKTCGLEYDFEIRTLKNDEKKEVNRSKFKEDILYVILASTFNHKDVSIYRNEDLFKQLTDLKTDPIDGITIELQIKKDGLNNIAFQIENGNLIFVDFCKNIPNFITLFFDGNKVIVNKMDYSPVFY